MLPHYSPLKVAETFSMLSGLHPERIDLGLGPRARHRPDDDARAAARPPPGGRPTTSSSSSSSCSASSRTGSRPTIPFAPPRAHAAGPPERPEPWLLGSSPQSAIWAAELGLPYSFADFINPEGAAIVADYRGRFVDSERLGAPRVSVGVIAICADTDEEAERLAASSRMMLSLLRQGRLIEIPPVDKALRYLETRDAPARAAGAR